MRKLLIDCFTGADGTTYDVGRVLWAIAFLFGLGFETASVVSGLTFSLQEYGIGVGALLLAGGGSLHLKASTEPGQP